MSPAENLFASGVPVADIANNPKAQQFMHVVLQLRTVSWRDKAHTMNADGIAVCEMIEKGLHDPITLKGQLI